MSEDTIRLLIKSPWGLSRLAGMSGGRLEKVTGLELAGMFMCAPQKGRLSEYSKLWTVERAIVPPSMLEERWVEANDPNCCADNAGIPAPRWTPTRGNSSEHDPVSWEAPVTDPSPSEIPTIHLERLPYYYYKYKFAGLETPFLGIGCTVPSSRRKICPFGGSKDGDRTFISSWKYGTARASC